MSQQEDMVNHPRHYASLDPEPIDVIESWDLDHHRATALKYIARCNLKHASPVEDLEKAIFYLKRKVALEKKRRNGYS